MSVESDRMHRAVNVKVPLHMSQTDTAEQARDKIVAGLDSAVSQLADEKRVLYPRSIRVAWDDLSRGLVLIATGGKP